MKTVVYLAPVAELKWKRMLLSSPRIFKKTQDMLLVMPLQRLLILHLLRCRQYRLFVLQCLGHPALNYWKQVPWSSEPCAPPPFLAHGLECRVWGPPEKCRAVWLCSLLSLFSRLILCWHCAALLCICNVFFLLGTIALGNSDVVQNGSCNLQLIIQIHKIFSKLIQCN